ncbi:CHASE2 domain-containing protein [Methylicorpusculum sp.]|uniref:CHASE2 domain-containing protein n=1 Tax=Methylicorpusculum sp. TaxID=2713644 RepID=UPI00271C1150|nr:adenylate/guanylate cyclase domain-containing protein [Methylicorpusculum sp.]MDO8845825.1 adenylate/guanylate cyclase domain-containing protein [Methylicorpusculum sp.]
MSDQPIQIRHRQKTQNTCVLAVLISLMGVFLSLSPFGAYLEEEMGLTWLFHMRGPITPPEEVVIVSIDKASAEILRLPDDPEKWPRSYYAQLIRKLNQQRPSIIGFNIIFEESRDDEGDLMLAEAMKEGRNIVLSNYLKQGSLSSIGPLNQFRYETIIEPIPILNQVALGTAPFPLPKSSSSIKQFWAFKSSAGDIATFPVAVFQSHLLKQAYPAILDLIKTTAPELSYQFPPDFEGLVNTQDNFETLQIVQSVLSKQSLADDDSQTSSTIKSTHDHTHLLKSWAALLKENDSLLLNHYGKAGTLTTIPFYQALVSDILNPDLFSNKIVLIGYSENIMEEKNRGFYTVYSEQDGSTISPIELAATAIANLLEHSWLKALPVSYQLSLLILWSLFLSLACRFCSFSVLLAVIASSSAAYLSLASYCFNQHYLWLPLFIPIVVQALSVILTAAVGHYLAGKREHKNMFNAFSRYVPSDMVNRMAGHGSLDELNSLGELINGVCMASDAGQYTSLSESLPPKALSTLMNHYYGNLFPEVQQHGGIISDVIGDAMLAIWAKSDHDDKALRTQACQAALAIQQAVDRFNGSQPHTLSTRLGLHYGEMHLGNVGSTDHFEYRAVGDVINTATRIEGLNKILGTRILVTNEVIHDLELFLKRELGFFILKGKTHPVCVYELIGLTVSGSANTATRARHFEEALHLFQSNQWTQAHDSFLAIAEKYPDDGPTRFYLNYLTHQPATSEQPPIDFKQKKVIDLGNITTALQ